MFSSRMELNEKTERRRMRKWSECVPVVVVERSRGSERRFARLHTHTSCISLELGLKSRRRPTNRRSRRHILSLSLSLRPFESNRIRGRRMISSQESPIAALSFWCSFLNQSNSHALSEDTTRTMLSVTLGLASQAGLGQKTERRKTLIFHLCFFFGFFFGWLIAVILPTKCLRQGDPSPFQVVAPFMELFMNYHPREIVMI